MAVLMRETRQLGTNSTCSKYQGNNSWITAALTGRSSVTILCWLHGLTLGKTVASSGHCRTALFTIRHKNTNRCTVSHCITVKIHLNRPQIQNEQKTAFTNLQSPEIPAELHSSISQVSFSYSSPLMSSCTTEPKIECFLCLRHRPCSLTAPILNKGRKLRHWIYKLTFHSHALVSENSMGGNM